MSVYSDIEEQVRTTLVTRMPKLQDTECVVAKIDEMLISMLENDRTHGVNLEFGGWTTQPQRPQKFTKGAWVVEGVYFIRLTEDNDPDVELRDTVQELRLFVGDDPRLGQTTPFAYLTHIGRSEAGKVNDIPFIMVPFFIEAWDMEENK